jgi:hypothetical protein
LRLAADLKIWHDPPRLDYRAIADDAGARGSPLAGRIDCSGRTGSVLAFCLALRGDGIALLAAANKVAVENQARAVTIARLSGATANHATAAARSQATVLDGLDATVSADEQAEAAALGRLASLLRSAHLTITLSTANDARLIAAYESVLRQHGVNPSAVGALTPSRTPVDVIAGLIHLAATATPAPSAVGPTITAVHFRGSPSNPAMTVLGSNLGTAPSPSPSSHPSGHGGCPSFAGDDGYDYGTSLYLAVPSANWSAGRYNPSLKETDCIDLVVTKYTPTEIDFHFGAFYTSTYPKFSLAGGTSVQIDVAGTNYTTTVRYLTG